MKLSFFSTLLIAVASSIAAEDYGLRATGYVSSSSLQFAIACDEISRVLISPS